MSVICQVLYFNDICVQEKLKNLNFAKRSTVLPARAAYDIPTIARHGLEAPCYVKSFSMNTLTATQVDLKTHFTHFRENIIGQHTEFDTPFGRKKIIYADWVASGRLYAPIEKKMRYDIAPFVGNTHTETTITGTSMTIAYHEAREIIKRHVNATKHDILVATGSGMTGVVNKFQRILGLKVPEKLNKYLEIPEAKRPIVFVTHMEHHSNQTSWIETIADVVCIHPNAEGLVDMAHFEQLLEQYKDREIKIAAVTSCSNVTGVFAPYRQIARRMHESGGYCFVDFACSAPYVDIDMHPADPLEKLDAIYFSPHKFLGGPGTPGVLIFCSSLYTNKVPDNPGGGTVKWTNPWGGHSFFDNIEAREDGGTPGFLQTIRAAFCIQLKEQMGVENIMAREHELVKRVFTAFREMPSLHILADNIEDRLGAISFYIDDLHYNLGVKLLNDRYGIQVRGGCSCAGTYGHYLLNVTEGYSDSITCKIDNGDNSEKPGWIRLSLHPTMTDEDLETIIDAVRGLEIHHKSWAKDYRYDCNTNEFVHLQADEADKERVMGWFA